MNPGRSRRRSRLLMTYGEFRVLRRRTTACVWTFRGRGCAPRAHGRTTRGGCGKKLGRTRLARKCSAVRSGHWGSGEAAHQSRCHGLGFRHPPGSGNAWTGWLVALVLTDRLAGRGVVARPHDRARGTRAMWDACRRACLPTVGLGLDVASQRAPSPAQRCCGRRPTRLACIRGWRKALLACRSLSRSSSLTMTSDASRLV